MSAERAFQIWRYSVAIGAAIILYLGFVRGRFPDNMYMTATLFTAVCLTVLAFRLRKSSPQFNLTVAAETIVAFGIYCLIVGLGSAVVLAMNLAQAQPPLANHLPAMAWAFAEALATAALAPILAMLLRTHHVYLRIATSGAGDLDDAARAAKALTEQISLTVTRLASLNSALEKEVKALSDAAGSAASAAKSLADKLKTESDRARDALHQLEAGAIGFAKAAESSREAANSIEKPLKDIGSSANETRIALDALSTATVSVERFLRPSGAS